MSPSPPHLSPEVHCFLGLAVGSVLLYTVSAVLSCCPLLCFLRSFALCAFEPRAAPAGRDGSGPVFLSAWGASS